MPVSRNALVALQLQIMQRRAGFWLAADLSEDLAVGYAEFGLGVVVLRHGVWRAIDLTPDDTRIVVPLHDRSDRPPAANGHDPAATSCGLET